MQHICHVTTFCKFLTAPKIIPFAWEIISSFFYPWKDQKDKSDKLNVEIDYIADDPELDPVTLQFSKVFDAFRAAQIVDNEMNQDSRKGPIKQVKPLSI